MSGFVCAVALVGLGVAYGVLYLGFAAATEWRLRGALARGLVVAEPGPRLHRFTANALAQNPDIDYRYGAFEVPPGQARRLRGRVAAGVRHLSIVLYDPLMQSVADGVCPGPTAIGVDHLAVEADGRFDVVLADRDPGTGNWLDTSAVPCGFVVVRHIGAAPEALERLDQVAFSGPAEPPASS